MGPLSATRKGGQRERVRVSSRSWCVFISISAADLKHRRIHIDPWKPLETLHDMPRHATGVDSGGVRIYEDSDALGCDAGSKIRRGDTVNGTARYLPCLCQGYTWAFNDLLRYIHTCSCEDWSQLLLSCLATHGSTAYLVVPWLLLTTGMGPGAARHGAMRCDMRRTRPRNTLGLAVWSSGNCYYPAKRQAAGLNLYSISIRKLFILALDLLSPGSWSPELMHATGQAAMAIYSPWRDAMGPSRYTEFGW